MGRLAAQGKLEVLELIFGFLEEDGTRRADYRATLARFRKLKERRDVLAHRRYMGQVIVEDGERREGPMLERAGKKAKPDEWVNDAPALADLEAEIEELRIFGARLAPIFEEVAHFWPGEAAGLRRCHVDFLRRKIKIVEQLVEVDGKPSFAPPKTEASKATLSMPDFVVDLLAEQIARYPDPDVERGLLFTSDWGTPLRKSNFARRVFEPAVAAAGLSPALSFHSLRHATATWSIHQGCDPLQIMKLMRHAKVTTTFNVYGHLWDDVDERLDTMREDTYAEVLRTKRGQVGA